MIFISSSSLAPNFPSLALHWGVEVERNEIRAFKKIYFDKRGIGSKYYFRVHFATMSRVILSGGQPINKYLLNSQCMPGIIQGAETENSTEPAFGAYTKLMTCCFCSIIPTYTGTLQMSMSGQFGEFQCILVLICLIFRLEHGIRNCKGSD